MIPLLFGAVFIIPFFVSAAGMQQASIITRPGVATSPIKYYFDFSSALSEGINHAVKVTVSASNAEKTAVRFESVKLFDQSGAVLGNNVASKTDALSSTPYAFVFQNFGVSAEDLKKVAGVQITFLDLGGDNPTGKVTVQNVTMSLDRNVGEACIIADPLVIPILPPPTVVAIQTSRPLEPGGGGAASGEGGSGSSCAGGSSPEACYPRHTYDEGASNVPWSNVTNTYASDNQYGTVTLANGESSNYLFFDDFRFNVPLTATIDGMLLSIERKASVGSTVKPFFVALTGTSVQENKATGSYWPATEGTETYGGATDLWGDDYAPADINNNSTFNPNPFGLQIGVTNDVAGTVIASIDTITITVYYTTGGGSVYDSLRYLIKSLFRWASGAV